MTVSHHQPPLSLIHPSIHPSSPPLEPRGDPFTMLRSTSDTTVNVQNAVHWEKDGGCHQSSVSVPVGLWEEVVYIGRRQPVRRWSFGTWGEGGHQRVFSLWHRFFVRSMCCFRKVLGGNLERKGGRGGGACGGIMGKQRKQQGHKCSTTVECYHRLQVLDEVQPSTSGMGWLGDIEHVRNQRRGKRQVE